MHIQLLQTAGLHTSRGNPHQSAAQQEAQSAYCTRLEYTAPPPVLVCERASALLMVQLVLNHVGGLQGECSVCFCLVLDHSTRRGVSTLYSRPLARCHRVCRRQGLHAAAFANGERNSSTIVPTVRWTHFPGPAENIIVNNSSSCHFRCVLQFPAVAGQEQERKSQELTCSSSTSSSDTPPPNEAWTLSSRDGIEFRSMSFAQYPGYDDSTAA